MSQNQALAIPKDPENYYKRKRMLWLFEKPYPRENNKDYPKTPCTDWSIYRAVSKQINNRKYFSCSKVRPSAEQAGENSLFLIYDSQSERVLRVRTSNDSTKKFVCNPDQPTMLPTEVKAEIAKLFRLNMKPRTVLDCLYRMNPFPLPSKTQLTKYISLMRDRDKNLAKQQTEPSTIPVEIGTKTKQLSKIIDLRQLGTLLASHANIPTTDYSSFVVACEVSSPDDCDPTFRFFISTRQLIGIASKAKVIHASTVFHLSWQTFPLFIMGTTDKDSVFHPFGVSVAEQLKADDFIYFFSLLKSSVKEYYKQDMNPSYLMCNGSEAIQRAFMNVFGPNVLMLTCWSHVRKQIIKNVLALVEAPKRIEILSDIDTLQLASRHDIFDQASQHFLKKWRNESAFCNYMEREWINRNHHWFEGAAKGCPSTNNALEAFNINVRNKMVLHNEFKLEDSLINILEMVSDWSDEYRQEIKRVTSVPTISQRLWVDSYQWYKLPKNIIKCKNRQNCSIYRIPFNRKPRDVVRDMCPFNLYKEQYFNECEVSLPLGSEGWLKGTCNCPTFQKTFLCKHILGMAITLKEVEVPPEVRREPIGDSCKNPKQLCRMASRAETPR